MCSVDNPNVALSDYFNKSVFIKFSIIKKTVLFRERGLLTKVLFSINNGEKEANKGEHIRRKNRTHKPECAFE